MKLYINLFMAAVLGSLMILLESCSSSTLVDVWSDPAYHGAPLKKILIIAIRKDATQRRIWEDAFVSELSKQGIMTESSYHLFPDALPDTDQVIQMVHDKGFDGILVTRLLYAETKTNIVQPYVTREQETQFNNFRRRYDTYYHNVLHPGYIESEIIDRRAIDVWVIRDEDRMIWSATSNTPELNTVEAVQTDIVNLVIPQLLKNSIIESRQK